MADIYSDTDTIGTNIHTSSEQIYTQVDNLTSLGGCLIQSLIMTLRGRKKRQGRTMVVYMLFVAIAIVNFNKFDLILNIDQQREKKTEPPNNLGGNWSNPTLLTPGMSKLWFDSNDVRYELPTDADWIMKYHSPSSWAQHKAVYMREYTDELEYYSKQINCTGTLDVLNWLSTNENVNSRRNVDRGSLMVAYGGLIHVLREKDFVDKDTGNYLDDDIDSKSNMYVCMSLFCFVLFCDIGLCFVLWHRQCELTALCTYSWDLHPILHSVCSKYIQSRLSVLP